MIFKKSHKKTRNSTCHLDIPTWNFLQELLEHGYPLMDALSLLHIDAKRLHEQLEQGRDIFEILLRHETKRFYKHLYFFTHIMSLSNAIQSASHLDSFEKDIVAKFLKKSIYPICIFVFAYCMLWVFSSSIIPQMMNSFAMDDQFKGLSVFVSVMKLLCGFLAFLFIVFALCALYFKCNASLRTALLCRYAKVIFMLQDYQSYRLAGYLLEMQKRGISTKQAFMFLSSMQECGVFHHMVCTIQERLAQGEEYTNILSHHPLISERFCMACNVAICSQKHEAMLSSFMKQQEFVWDKTIKKVGVCLQIISYSFVALVVLIVYQIMLVPLSMLEQM